MSRTIKSLRFFLTCKVTNYSALVSRVLQENRRLLGQRKGCSHSRHSKQREHQHICVSSSCAQVPQGCCSCAQGVPAQTGVCRTGTQNLKRIFFLGSKRACPLLRRRTLSLFQSCLLYKYPGIKDLQKELEKSTSFFFFLIKTRLSPMRQKTLEHFSLMALLTEKKLDELRKEKHPNKQK